MDAWSSPWGDDSATPQASTSKQAKEVDDIFPTRVAQLSSLNAFDASDPWANDSATPVQESDPLPVSSAPSSTQNIHTTDDAADTSFQSTSYTVTAWGDASTSPVREALDPPTTTPAANHLPPADDSETRTRPDRQQSLSSYDPWAAGTSSGWGDEPGASSATFPTTEPESSSTGWGANEIPYSPPRDLEQHFSATHLGSPTSSANPYAAHEAVERSSNDQASTGTGLDVWAAEASTREEKARRLDREEIDELKVDARKLISSIKTDKETQASFANPSSTQEGWTDLFGSQGTQRDKLHHLQTPPSALTSSSGALRANVLQSSPATLNQLRGSIVKTENRGVKLASAESSSSWQRGSRPTTKTDWLPDQLTAEADGLSFGVSSAAASSNTSATTSGPGWTQTSSNETRSTSGSGFLASFFKARQASAASTAAAPDSAPKPARSSTSSFEASPGMSSNAQFEPYQDTAGKRYSDDPTGPDLLSLDTDTARAPTAPSKDTPSGSAQGAGLLSRWRNSGIFKASGKKQNPNWASSNLRGDDLDWLDEQESADSRVGRYHYNEDEEADDAFNSSRDSAPPLPPSKAKTEVAPASQALDPFDNLFDPVQPMPSFNAMANTTATSSARSSFSASRMSGDGGMVTINTNLGRTNSFRKSAASPLQPPPQSQGARMPFAPPPRAHAASPNTVQKPAPTTPDPFADFLTDAPSQPTSNASGFKAPPPATTTFQAPPTNGKGGALTADDLLFFDSL
ncbi:hypothetical protein PSEUBRA_006284 [Kalmanozyma brasiliensis GHG001]|uniref:uncharacterized protein n=1 Tax=Kalmanozyma brasiliensis (strain GHG001) TaxID=1365824 RepID=UPI002867C156|nr:uncharacterized protein PSEUBRA_006284 [Kalmanozyma brasiliensis GHG001]KAF6767653.1 hypothetical protein PSEUBRA_006284 [Kalmanozyma brasiliensis GHG001]